MNDDTQAPAQATPSERAKALIARARSGVHFWKETAELLEAELTATKTREAELAKALKEIVEDYEHCKEHLPDVDRQDAYYATAKAALQHHESQNKE